MLLVSVLASLQSACAKNVLMAQAVMLPPIARDLKTPIPPPVCALKVKDDYSVAEVVRSLDCWQAAYGKVIARYDKLRSAVSVREKAAAAIEKGV